MEIEKTPELEEFLCRHHANLTGDEIVVRFDFDESDVKVYGEGRTDRKASDIRREIVEELNEVGFEIVDLGSDHDTIWLTIKQIDRKN